MEIELDELHENIPDCCIESIQEIVPYKNQHHGHLLPIAQVV